MMNRREFLKAAAAGCMIPSRAIADSHSPFEGLIDVREERPFVAEEGKYVMALFMTAQKSFPSCGEDVIGVHQVIDTLELQDDVTRVIVMPRVDNQSDPDDRSNLDSIWQNYTDFKILTGSLEQIKAVTQQIDGAFFEYDENGKVSSHTRDAFFFAPNGNFLMRHAASDYFGMAPVVEGLISRCKTFLGRTFCL